MRLSSFRTRVLLLAIVFSVLLVGTVLITTYFVVSGGMQQVAGDTALRLSRQAGDVLRGRALVIEEELANEAPAASGESTSVRGAVAFEAAVPELFHGGVTEGYFAFYVLQGTNLRLVWYSNGYDPSYLGPQAGDRRRALDTRTSTLSRIKRDVILPGLFSEADLGTYTVHVPVSIPGGGTGVLDVVYLPFREQATIDSVRSPMIVLAIVGTALAIGMMQTSMGWVLRLVDELRVAADSVDAGELEVELPDAGQHEIGDLARSLNALIGRLKRRADAQTRFIADASHELATPVAGIRGYVNILRAWGADDADVREESIKAIDRESRRMVRLCSELLSMIRSEQDTECRWIRCDVNALAREALAGAATRYIEKGLEFVGPDEGQVYTQSDPDRIEEVLAILTDNAAKYTPGGGRVAVQTWWRGETIVIEVSDTGVGIPADDLPNIFERFYRSDASRSSETGGFGLGLAIAKRLVETCGGEIEARSVLGEGTTFQMRLPRGRA